MSRFSVLFLLLSLVIVNSGDNSSTINSKTSSSSNTLKNSSNSPIQQSQQLKRANVTINQPVASAATQSGSGSGSGSAGSGSGSSKSADGETSEDGVQRDKRGAPTAAPTAAGGNFQLDDSEIARQNQITQQIFANYVERRLFPHRSTNQKIPTIAEILPRPQASTTPRPRPRGFSSAAEYHSYRRGAHGRKRSGSGRAQHHKRGSAPRQQQLISDSDYAETDVDDAAVTDDGQESLQSVESEQHDQYYSDVFNRDPSENEIDSDCPNCVDETQYANKWTMPLLKLGEKRYYLGIFFKANWFKATQYCRYHGMHLASISSQEENDRLEKHIRDFGLGHEHFWTSGTDLADEGTFFWMANGRPITFTNWNAGEPNNFRYENGEEENCMELWNRDGKGLKWNDSPCSFETYFVCEVQP